MRRPRYGWLLVLSLAAAVCAAAVSPGRLEGRWLLADQRYEGGEANLSERDGAVRLEIAPAGVWIWAGEDRSSALPWPAFVTDEGPLAVEVIERADDRVRGVVSARYRVRPAREDDLVLDVLERYELSGDGRSLTGTMHVRFTGGETNRGGFVLHRRFEREQ